MGKPKGFGGKGHGRADTEGRWDNDMYHLLYGDGSAPAPEPRKATKAPRGAHRRRGLRSGADAEHIGDELYNNGAGDEASPWSKDCEQHGEAPKRNDAAAGKIRNGPAATLGTEISGPPSLDDGFRAEALEPLPLSMPSAGLDDDALTKVLEKAADKVGSGRCRPSCLVADFSNNLLTEYGLCKFVDFATKHRVAVEVLRLQGNAMQSCRALVDLLKDAHVGLPSKSRGAIRELHINSTQISCDVFWRMCEAVVKSKPRPPFTIRFHDGTLGPLREVIITAEAYGLTASGRLLGQQVAEEGLIVEGA